MERKRIVICDVDGPGIIADATERFKQATRLDGSIDWDKALNGAYVHLDTLIDGAKEALATLASQSDMLVLLTSRYDHMAEASLLWLRAHEIDYRVIFKPWEKRYTKTKVWKAEQVLTLARVEQASELIVIDDDQPNLDEIKRLVSGLCPLAVCKSLQDAIGPLQWITEPVATEQQIASIRKLCEVIGREKPEGLDLSFADARKLIKQLTAEYKAARDSAKEREAQYGLDDHPF